MLARKQLASIDYRISNSRTSRWNEMLFKMRHARIKSIFADLLGRRCTAAGDEAVLGIIEDLEAIGSDDGEWQHAGKDETDYLRFVLHGIKAVTVTGSGKKEDKGIE